MKLSDSLLLKIALCVSLCGLLLLWFFSQSLDSEILRRDAQFVNDGSYSAQGKISRLRSSPTRTSFVLEYSCSLPVVFFSESSLENDMLVRVEGDVSDGEMVAEDVFLDESLIS